MAYSKCNSGLMKRLILALILSVISTGANASLIRIDFEGQVYAIFGLAPFAPKSLVTGFIVYDDTGFTLISRTLSKRPIMAMEECHAKKKKLLATCDVHYPPTIRCSI